MNNLLKKKKHINEITAEFKNYWEPFFLENPIQNPIFHAKLCYQGSEFELVDGKKTECVRFFSSELSKNQDIFIELFDWNDEPYKKEFRNLYVLKNNPDWKTTPNFSVEVTMKNDGTPLVTPTYAVRVSDLQLVSENSIKSAYPEMTNLSTENFQQSLDLDCETVDLNSLDEELPFTEKEDNHYGQMTIRDIYCIVQNVPLSNKKWLNALIDESKKWKK
jgi:hypothetical protein